MGPKICDCGRKCECGRKNVSVVGKFECAVSECECGEVECGVLSVTVPYLGNARVVVIGKICWCLCRSPLRHTWWPLEAFRTMRQLGCWVVGRSIDSAHIP